MKELWITEIWRHGGDGYKNVGTSSYWYVSRVSNGWQARIQERGGSGRTLYREVFDIEEDAARGADNFLLGRFGLEVVKREGWRLNFSEGMDLVESCVECEVPQMGLFG